MHNFRYWKVHPPTPQPVERRRSNRVVATCLTVAILLCAVAIVILFAFVLDLRNTRNHEAVDRQVAIDRTFCQVLAQLPANSPELDRIRTQLHCTQPGLTPEQMRRLATTGGTP